MANHRIEPEAGTLHGYFSKDIPPIMTINPGDTVRYSTLDARWAIEPPKSASEFGKKFEPRGEHDIGHALCGPIAIKGAKPGMTLAVHINRIELGAWGWSEAWYDPLGGAEDHQLFVWDLDTTII